MPDEPLIFVEVALVNGIAGSVDALIQSDQDDADEQESKLADTAIFYSISNAQAGLAGISFGDFLIKRVVGELQRDLPDLKQFCTLSPMPAMRSWMDRQLDAMLQKQDTGLPKAIEAALRDCDDLMGPKPPAKHPDEVSERTRTNIEYLTAWYLLNAKRVETGSAFDPVAHFHLTNGARVERLNWNGNGNENGWMQSFGMMVNYLYDLSMIEKNHESYVGQGKIAASGAVKRHLR